MIAAIREFDIGGSSSSVFEDGNRSRETPTERSRARNWRREENALVVAREQASRRVEAGRASRAETAWREVVWQWFLRRATATASSKARAASSVKHCLATLTGVGIADEQVGNHARACVYSMYLRKPSAWDFVLFFKVVIKNRKGCLLQQLPL